MCFTVNQHASLPPWFDMHSTYFPQLEQSSRSEFRISVTALTSIVRVYVVPLSLSLSEQYARVHL